MFYQKPNARRMLSAVAAATLCTFATVQAQAEDWSAASGPLAGEPRIIGSHGAACIVGAQQLPAEGEGYQTVDMERRRHYGHPVLLEYVQDLGRRVAAAGFGPMLVGDMAQPRGGPMSFGHVSHQSGLDVDIWFRLDLPPLERAEREGIEQPILVDPETGRLDDRWSDDHAELIHLATNDPRVARVFVDTAVKQDLCGREWEDRSWLRRVRSWPAHDEHLHVRLKCPPNSPECVDQPEPPPGEGCTGLVPSPRTGKESLPIRTLPAACRGILTQE